MSETKKIIGENIKMYLEAKGVKHNWVYDRIDMSKGAFYNLLKGEGNVDQFEQKILKLFRIKDPFYFHRSDLVLPKELKEINQEQHFMDFVALSYHGEEDEELKNGMEVFSDFVELIDVLQSLSGPSVLGREQLDQ